MSPSPPPRPRFGRAAHTVSYLTPPDLASFPVEREQIEYSSRSMVFRGDGDGVLRVWGAPEHPWVLGVTPAGRRWKVHAWGASARDARQAARELFSLDHPLEQFYRLARREPVLAPSIRKFRGLRIPRDASLYESLLHAVIGQQLSVQAANTLKDRLFHATDAYVEVEGIEVPHIPAPSSLLALGPTGLRGVGLSRVKSACLVELARRQTEGHFGGVPWGSLDLADAVERLDALPGVGRWTAENALLRGVGRPDVFVAGDLAIGLALEEYGVVRASASEDRRRAWARRHYPGWGSYATLYLWRRWVTERMEARAG